MKELTPRQDAILRFISGAVRANGVPPSLREIARHFNATAGGLQKQIRALEAKGVLKRLKGLARGLRVVAGVESGTQVLLPILGRVRAGAPMEAVENIEDHVSLERVLCRGADYLLRVRGDSMAPGIVEGDLLLVRRAQEASSGGVVVAYLAEEGDAAAEGVTVKRLRRVNGKAWLEADNPLTPSLRGRSFRIMGKVEGLLRHYAR